ncbi:cytochrome c oxidase subunit 1 [Thermus aquaticus]|uniref:Cytochrome c oxidase subunit 1 n=1 Tax=Thermus aquaticus TaxID=271 RepID=A0A0M9AHD9_THEAQ|nr:cbb3-type cytochrome c oxidase subunit I [Thermus aquaticus]KOX90885.1 cytochrome c oxidase subunit 1 [Thermus aquaticus]
MAVKSFPQVYAENPEKKLTLYYLVLGFVALLVGSLFGPFQALNYGNVDAYPLLKRLLPFVQSYYQGLTLHGVLNAIVFTQLLAMAVMFYLPARELRAYGVRPNLTWGWVAWWMAFLGLLVAALPLLANEATVLYTFYPPLKGHWAFYVGATVFVAASLVVGLLVIGMWLRFKQHHPERITPLATYMAVTFWLMWLLASLGLVVESVFLLIPWSLGLVQGVDPLLARTLFWYTGHPIVYFWLLPAYALLYLVLPKLAGGKLISDPLARVVFLLFLLFSVPVGFHHQYADPGITPTWKFVHAVLTLFVAVPSLITAFTVAASLELAGRMRGGKGLFGWIKALPWDNPAFVAPVLGLIAFIPGGAGGIVNASYTLNYVIHNTTWVPGHFHLQVGTLVTMTMMGAVFWLVPQLTGKPLTEGIRKAGLAGMWLWFVGMLVMAVGMHWQGLLNVPRRAYIAQAPDAYTHAAVPMVFNILAGIILLLAIVLFFYAFFALLFRGERRAEVAAEEVPFAEVLSDGGDTPAMRLLDRIWFWFALAVLLVVLAYGPTLVQLFGNLNPVPGWRLW